MNIIEFENEEYGRCVVLEKKDNRYLLSLEKCKHMYVVTNCFDSKSKTWKDGIYCDNYLVAKNIFNRQ